MIKNHIQLNIFKYCRVISLVFVSSLLLQEQCVSCSSLLYSKDHLAAHNIESFVELLSSEKSLGRRKLHCTCFTSQGNDELRYLEVVKKYRVVTTRRLMDQDEVCVILHGHEDELLALSRYVN